MLSYRSKKETDEAGVTLRRRPSHRRQSSVGISFYRNEEHHTTHRRRFSYASSSWIRDADDEGGEEEDEPDEISTRTGRSRPYSWGPIGDYFYRDSLSFCDSERSPISHHECNSYRVYDLIMQTIQCCFLINCIIITHPSSGTQLYFFNGCCTYNIVIGPKTIS